MTKALIIWLSLGLNLINIVSESHDITTFLKVLILFFTSVYYEDFFDRFKGNVFDTLTTFWFSYIFGCNSFLAEHPLRLSL